MINVSYLEEKVLVLTGAYRKLRDFYNSRVNGRSSHDRNSPTRPFVHLSILQVQLWRVSRGGTCRCVVYNQKRVECFASHLSVPKDSPFSYSSPQWKNSTRAKPGCYFLVFTKSDRYVTIDISIKLLMKFIPRYFSQFWYN